jgi:hypothetical protein
MDWSNGWGLWITWTLTYVAWWLFPIIFLWIYKVRLSKFPIDVVIYEKRGENLVKTCDMAGRFDSPIACYRLKVSKDTLPIPQYDWVLQCMDKPTNLFEKLVNILRGKIGSVTLFKYASKQYKPIRVKLDNGQVVEKLRLVTDKNGQPLYISTYEYINPKQAMSKLNFEVIDWDDINHMTQELRAIAVRRSPVADFIQKYGPMIAIVLAILALIIAGYYYKEIVTSAHPQGISLPNQANGQQEIATQPNIPVIGNLIPGT